MWSISFTWSWKLANCMCVEDSLSQILSHIQIVLHIHCFTHKILTYHGSSSIIMTGSAKMGLIAFPNSQLQWNIFPKVFKVSPSYYSAMLEVKIRTKFQSSAKFTSQVMGLQVCATGISYRPFFAEPVTIDE